MAGIDEAIWQAAKTAVTAAVSGAVVAEEAARESSAAAMQAAEAAMQAAVAAVNAATAAGDARAAAAQLSSLLTGDIPAAEAGPSARLARGGPQAARAAEAAWDSRSEAEACETPSQGGGESGDGRGGYRAAYSAAHSDQESAVPGAHEPHSDDYADGFIDQEEFLGDQGAPDHTAHPSRAHATRALIRMHVPARSRRCACRTPTDMESIVFSICRELEDSGCLHELMTWYQVFALTDVVVTSGLVYLLWYSEYKRGRCALAFEEAPFV